MEKARISINVRGTIFKTFIETLERFLDYLLVSNSSRQHFNSSVRDELIFDRNVGAFDAILFLLSVKWLPYPTTMVICHRIRARM